MLIISYRTDKSMSQSRTNRPIRKEVAYYDENEGKLQRRIFSALEISRINEIFFRIEDTLSCNKKLVRRKFFSVERCNKCPEAHDKTAFISEIDTKSLSAKIMDEIKEVLNELQCE